MKVAWLGQNGLYIEVAGLRMMIDPYLSDSVGEKDSDKHRRQPVTDWMLGLMPDVIIFTHDHPDHYDPWSAGHLLRRSGAVTVLGPDSCWQKARTHKGDHNYVLMNAGTRWTQGGVRLTAVPAVHSDPAAIGILIEAEDRCLYVTGDTLYNSRVLNCLPKRIDAVFLPINGAGNNMNMVDAAQFARDCGANVAVPVHWGMFDALDPMDFDFEPKIIPKYGEMMEIGDNI